jgi:ComF family protein
VDWLALPNAFVRTFLAPRCVGCDEQLERPLAAAVCPPCWHAVRRLTAPICLICGDQQVGLPGALARDTCERCAASPPRFSIARSAGRYDGAFRNVIHAFKYQHRRALAKPLSLLMREAGDELLAGADAVVPVPLHPWRLMRRGFNQADDLAAYLGLPVWRALRRTRGGRPQASQRAAARRGNVAHAFACGPPFGLSARLWRRRLAGRVIVLVDDVMTTGATLDACSGVLRAAGVRTVRALTAARAVAERPSSPPAPRVRVSAPRR